MGLESGPFQNLQTIAKHGEINENFKTLWNVKVIKSLLETDTNH